MDRDNFESVLQKLDLRIELPSGAIAIREMDDFHPDQIAQRLPIFQLLYLYDEYLGHFILYTGYFSFFIGNFSTFKTLTKL